MITLRIQFKGDAARQLALEEGNDRAPQHDLRRTLSQFSVPTPDSTRTIYKSGFILCNYDVSRESKTFEQLERGARRAQSLGFKTTLESLSISYVHLFENSRPIFLGPKAQNIEHVTKAPYESRWRSVSPPADNERGRRPLFAHRTWVSPTYNAASSSGSNKQTSSAQPAQPERHTGNNADSADKFLATVPKPARASAASSLSQSTATSRTDPIRVQETLKILSKSASFQALLHPTPAETQRDPYIKREDTMSPERYFTRPNSSVRNEDSRGSLPATDSSTKTSRSPVSFNIKGASREIGRDRSYTHESDRERSSQSHETRSRTESAQPSHRSSFRSVSGERKFTRWGEPIDHHDPPPGNSLLSRIKPLHSEHTRYESSPSYYHRSKAARSASPPSKADTYSRDHRSGLIMTTYTKRPLSPDSSRRRSASPPPKRRMLSMERTPFTRSLIDLERSPNLKKESDVEEYPKSRYIDVPSPAKAIPTGPKALVKRLSSTFQDVKPGLSQSVVFRLRPSYLEQTKPSPPPSFMNEYLPVDSSNTTKGLRTPQTMALNRELWDVRRQLTALKAREAEVLAHLRELRAPIPAEPNSNSLVAPPSQTITSEAKVKSLEAEIATMKERLKNETELRKLAEVACETERRRRKLAEGMLDDARREQNTPSVVPAVMDAFQKIAQLTGSALMDAEE